MTNKKRSKKKKLPTRKNGNSLSDFLSIYSKLSEMKQQIDKFSEGSSQHESRLADLEVHVSLVTRLLTTLCVEKFGITIPVLKRLVKRIEKEAVRDSQISELESLYQLSHEPKKKHASPPSKVKEDPWDKIS